MSRSIRRTRPGNSPPKANLVRESDPLTRAVSFAALDWTPLNLRKMFRESGRAPSSILSLTPNEFAHLFPLSRDTEDVDKSTRVAVANRNENERRAKRGQPLKLTESFRKTVEGTL